MDAAAEITTGNSRTIFMDLGQPNNTLFEYNNQKCLWATRGQSRTCSLLFIQTVPAQKTF